MDPHRFDDTIAAVSTPPGRSGIGIVRMSGPCAVGIADALFRPASPTRRASLLETFTTAYGRICDGDETVDEVILTVMRGPRTYTTQDVVEINCHGGMVALGRTLDLVIAHGARLADPGEFTKRAFYFGRIDLAQAEAVADVINAQTDEARRAAVAQLDGRLSEEIGSLREALVDLMAALEASLDFAEDGIEIITPAQTAEACASLTRRLDDLIATAAAGRAIRDGVRTAIVGRPNVGKSSLLNALLGRDRAIVTPVPGTTRDVVEDTVDLSGIALILRDTAGLRETDDAVEAEGVSRARAAIDQADLVLLVMDGAEPLTSADRALMDAMPAESTILVINKDDLPAGFEQDALAAWSHRPSVRISARTGAGLDALRDVIADVVWGGQTAPRAGVLVTNVRHRLALERTRQSVDCAARAVAQGLTEEYVASDIREALDALGEVLGVTLAQDIIDRIFERFCIGK